MSSRIYRFTFPPEIPFEEAQSSFLVARIAAEGIFGQARLRLDLSYEVDPTARSIVADAENEVGGAIAEIFASLLIREFGADAFQVTLQPATGALAPGVAS